jgi:hypothetical protein
VYRDREEATAVKEAIVTYVQQELPEATVKVHRGFLMDIP